MKVKELILQKLREQGEVRASDIVKATGFSRAYVDRFLRELREEGAIVITGKANTAKYIPATQKAVSAEKISTVKVCRILVNKGLNEDEILSDIRKKTGIFDGLRESVSGILEYAFTEMLNNAIEHSSSDKIEVRMEKGEGNVFFEVKDKGVGIFNNIMEKKGLGGTMSAIQDLLKGKQTTEPDSHSGEGIFFTSKSGQILTIESSGKKLIFDNLIGDVLLRDVRKETKGTRVVFSVSLDSQKDLAAIFREYTDKAFTFSKTEVAIKMYVQGASYVSRSQARRLLAGLEKFRTITLDFKGVDTIGQAFADEVFRVWALKHEDKEITVKNACPNVEFMIKRAKSA